MTSARAPQGERPRRLGEGDPCPACGATGGVAKDDDGYVCLMCGTPRVLVDGNVQRRGSEKPLLERAKALKFRRAAFGVIAALTLLVGVVSIGLASLTTLLFGALGVRGLMFGLAALVPLGASLASWLTVRHSGAAIRAAMTEAEVMVAKELIAVGAARTARDLGRLMHLPTGRTEELFGLAEVERLLDQPEAPPLERLRVGTDEPPLVDSETELRNRAR
jgi:hypothetical protein